MSKPRRITELPLTINPEISDLIPLAGNGTNNRVTIGTILNNGFDANFGNTTIGGDLDVTGTFRVSELVSSSIIYESGSTIFGNSSDDTHQFTGDVIVTGSFLLSGSNTFTNLGPTITSGSFEQFIPVNSNYSIKTQVDTELPLYSSVSSSTNFESDLGNWINDPDNNSDETWVRVSGRAVSLSSNSNDAYRGGGPKNAFSGSYYVTHGQYANQNDDARFEHPYTSRAVSFYYYATGETFGIASYQTYNDGVWTDVWSINESQQKGWIYKELTYPLAEKTRFRYIGASFVSGLDSSDIFALDLITVYNDVQTISNTESISAYNPQTNLIESPKILNATISGSLIGDSGNLRFGKFATGSGDNVSIIGSYNSVLDGKNDSIFGGIHNEIEFGTGNIGTNTILGGWGNQMSGSAGQNTIIGGCVNTIRNSSADTIIGGVSNDICDTLASFVVSYGTCVYGGFNSVVYGSAFSCISNSDYAGLLNAYNSYIIDSSHSTVLGGYTACITDGSDGSLVLGGDFNRIASNSEYSTIIAGEFGYISNSNYAAIIGGSDNLIESNSSYSSILNGLSNKISGSTYSGIVGGITNCILGVDKSFIIGSNISANRSCTTFVNNLNAEVLVTLEPTGSAPTNAPSGSIIVSGSGANLKPYFWNGSSWTSMI